MLGAAVAVFVWDRLPVALVAVGVALSLWATGVLGLDQALAGFGDPTVVFIASLFVVSEALEASGVTAWAGQALMARVGESRTRLIVLTLLLVALLTALISVNGAVAALIPVTVVLAVRLKRPPSQLLMPLAFGAHAGSLLALTSAKGAVQPEGTGGSSGNYGRFINADATAALAAYRTAADDASRTAAMNKLEQIFVDQEPMVPLMAANAGGEYSTQHWTGWPDDSNPYAPAQPTLPNSLDIVLHLVPATS